MAFTIQIRRDTAANWTGTNPTLLQGEQGLETDTGKVKIGDGSTAWNSLAYNSDGVDWTGANTNFSTTGSIDATSALFDGSSDQVQVTVQGHSTQTNEIFVVETSAGTDLFSVNNSGNVTVAGTVDGRDLATDGAKLDGIEAGADVTDQANVTAALAGGTVTGAVTIDGSANEVQLRVQGNSAQTSDIFVVENSAGTDLVTVDNSGRLDVAWRIVLGDTTGSVGLTTNDGYGQANITFNHVGGVPDVSGSSARIHCPVDNVASAMSFQLADNVTSGVAPSMSTPFFITTSYAQFSERLIIEGSGDGIQLKVQGNAVQTADIFVVENSAGTDLVTVDNSGNLDVAGTGTFGGSDAAGNALYLQSGDQAFIPADSTQIRFSYSNTNTYTHSLRTKHSANTAADNAIDFYLWKHGTDAAGDLGTHRALTIDLASSTLFGGLLIDGHSDDFQLKVQGHSTQTNNIFVIETSAGTDLLTVDNSGNTAITGTITAAGLPSGATAVAAGAAANELWVTSGHATLPDGVVMRA